MINSRKFQKDITNAWTCKNFFMLFTADIMAAVGLHCGIFPAISRIMIHTYEKYLHWLPPTGKFLFIHILLGGSCLSSNSLLEGANHG